MSNLTGDERLNLRKLMTEMNYTDNTSNIRRLKHSVKIRDDIRKIEALKKEYPDMRARYPEKFFNIVYAECAFLYDNYIDIFTRVMKDEIDTTIMWKLLIVMKCIEDGVLEQQEGSVRIGKLLKELYLDSAVKRADSLDAEYSNNKEPVNDGKKISWLNYKQAGL